MTSNAQAKTRDKAREKSRFIVLHENDNILVCCATASQGQSIEIEGEQVTLSKTINIGHKIARRNIAIGEKIIKYGAPIGSALQTIEIGAHVHMHNIKSDYIASHTRAASTGSEEHKG